MTKLTTLFLVATLSLASGTVLVANGRAQSNSGQADATVNTGQIASDAREGIAPSSVDNNGVDTGSNGIMLHPGGSSMNSDGMTKNREHKSAMCRDNRRPDTSKKVQTGDGINNDVDTRTDGVTQ